MEQWQHLAGGAAIIRSANRCNDWMHTQTLLALQHVFPERWRQKLDFVQQMIAVSAETGNQKTTQSMRTCLRCHMRFLSSGQGPMRICINCQYGERQMTRTQLTNSVEAHIQQLIAVVSVARSAAEYAGAHPDESSHNGIELLPGGMCARFVRQVFEHALHLPDGTWEFHARCAADMEYDLVAAGRQLHGCIPGAIGCLTDGTVGHTFIYLGSGECAECTSSERRGTPSRAGVKLTPLTAILAAHAEPARWYYGGPR